MGSPNAGSLDGIVNFADDDEGVPVGQGDPSKFWSILIVDDEIEVHEATKFALAGLQVNGRELRFLHAFSEADVRARLSEVAEIAIVLLDVVMETDDTGLRLVRVIREEYRNTAIRIILRTGQPGYAPELEVMQKYDINDYKSKTDLTRSSLTTATIAAIRSYSQIRTIAALHEQSTAIASMSAAFFDGVDEDAGYAAIEKLGSLARLCGQRRCEILWRDGIAGDFSSLGPGPDAERTRGLPGDLDLLDRLASGHLVGMDANGNPVAGPAAAPCASLLVPVIPDGVLRGVLVLESADQAHEWQPENLVLVRIAADVVGRGLLVSRRAREIRELNAGLELRVRERTRDLEIANRELEAYSYTVSHDLRAPLRQIAGFTGLMQASLGPTLDEENRGFMTATVQAAERMGKLIEDLLEFARAGRAALVADRLRLDLMIAEIRVELAPQAGARNIDWKVDALPELHADRGMFHQVMVNLLSNAVKYTRDTRQARIEIGSLPMPAGSGETCLFVRDNGAGFDMAYADRLFHPFTRLHSASEFEGTGIGLATVKSIVQRHGGRIWAEAEKGKGATFYVVLPDGPAAASAAN